ncbi:MAG: 2-dehydropantoate 2-reductase [Lachnospiraceae bacterium]|nr:2-dehydropantoate 2-reductase [Lachnospiraceae bacterium]
MKICMIGAGSLGSTIGGTLAENGHEVTFVDSWQGQIDAIRERGLHMVKSLEGDPGRFVPVRAQTDYHGLEAQDLCIVLVKSFATREAVREARDSHVIGPDTTVMTIQNGLGNEEAIMEEIGESHVISGKTFCSGFLIKPGKVMATTEGRVTYIGEMDGRVTERIQTIGAELNRGGLQTVVSENIRGMIWDKLLVNVATGALCGATGLPYGGLYEKYGWNALPEMKTTALAAVQEAIDVAKAYGVRLTSEDPSYAWEHAAEGQPESFKASILQSIERGGATEIDFINGAVSAWGKKADIPTPVNDTLAAIIRGIEYRMQRERLSENK